MDGSGENKALQVQSLYDSTACASCARKPPRGEKLRRCRGCNIVVYCGRECQASAWPTHRSLCRSRNQQDEATGKLAGYPTAVGLMSAVADWVEIHKYALTVLAHSAIRGTGGLEANLRLGRMIVFVLEPYRPTDSASAGVSPAAAFILSKVNNQDGDHVHVPPIRKLVSDSFGSRYVEGGFRGDATRSDTTPDGFVPVTCIVEGTSTPSILRYPIYRPSRHPDDATDQQTVGFFQDINRIFHGFINNGIVLRAPVDGQIGAPPSGIMVRAKKGWKWQQTQLAWQCLDMAVPDQNPPFNTPGSATELWMRFQQW